MGKFYRNGRLWSADTFKFNGTRTLAAATESDLWSGTATTRPTPSGQQLRVVSSSIEDDASKAERQTITIAGTMDPTKPKIVEITVAGTMQPATFDKWTCTLAGGVNTGDIARLTLNGTNFDTEVTPALNTLVLLSAEVATSGNSGTWDIWKVVPGGTLDNGDEITLTIPGSAAPFVVTIGGGILTATNVATELKNAVNADGTCPYSASSFNANLTLTKKVRGAGITPTCTWTTDPGLDATVTVTHEVTGVAGQSAWTCTTDGVSAVIAEHATAGVTADTVASSYAVDGGAASTFVAVHTITGEAADIAAFTVDGTSFSHTIVTGNDATAVALALKNALNGQTIGGKLFAASAAGPVITVTGPLATTYTVVNTCVNTQAGGVALSCTPNTTQANANADILAVSDGTTTFSRTVLTAVLADEVAALAALIDASASYTATALAGVITVNAPEGAAAFAFVNASTDNQTADLTVTIATVIAAGGGTGIRTLRIDYLDALGVRQSETVTMNGTTAVLTTATDIGALLGLTAATVGSNGSAVGTVSVTNVGNTTTFGGLAIGTNQDDAAAFTVPAGLRGYVTKVAASAGATATTVKLCSDTNPATGTVVNGAKFVWASALFGTTPEDIDPCVPWGPFPAGAQVWLTGTSAGGAACQGSMEGYNEPA